MTTKNKYANCSKISEKKTREIIKLFSFDLDASQITKIRGLNRNTVNRYLTEIVPNCRRAMLQEVIPGKAKPESIIHSDGWRGYNGLTDLGNKKHF